MWRRSDTGDQLWVWKLSWRVQWLSSWRREGRFWWQELLPQVLLLTTLKVQKEVDDILAPGNPRSAWSDLDKAGVFVFLSEYSKVQPSAKAVAIRDISWQLATANISKRQTETVVLSTISLLHFYSGFCLVSLITHCAMEKYLGKPLPGAWY